MGRSVLFAARRVGGAALCLALLFGARPAAAQPEGEAAAEDGEGASVAAQADSVEAAQQARAHFREGLEAFQNRLYRDAIQSFELAAQIIPSADLSFNIGRAYEELARGTDGAQRVANLQLAIENYERYLRDRVDPPDREEVETHLRNLRGQAEATRAAVDRPTEGVLVVQVNRDATAIELDGDAVGESPAEEERPLPPGRHELTLRRDGYVPFRSEVSLEPGVTTVAVADLLPETRYRAIRNPRIFTWLTWGLGVVSLGASIALGVHADSQIAGDADAARDTAALGDVFAGAAIGLAVVGLILWFVEGRTVRTERITVDDEDRTTIREEVESAPAVAPAE